jgi:CheY-like chemotaxis protein
VSAAGTVLLVDNDPGTRRALRSGLTDTLDSVEVLAAGNPRVAMSVLDERPVDILVIDLSMPLLDGFFLLATVSGRFPRMPVVVLSDRTAHADGRLSGSDALRILPLPTNHERVAAVVAEALDRVRSGEAGGLSLRQVLLMAAAERLSCTMLVASGPRKGRLYFHDGDLVNAFSEDFAANGEAAARDILGWGDAVAQIEPPADDVASTIDTPLHDMLDQVDATEDEARARVHRAVPPAEKVALTLDEEVVMPFEDDAPIRPTELDLGGDAAGTDADDGAAVSVATVSREEDAAASGGAPTARDASGNEPDPSADPVDAQPPGLASDEPAPVTPTPDGLEPHVALLAAAMERLSQRVQAADAALAAVGDEVVAFREARRHVEEVSEARERRLKELEAFREEVSRLAREILGRVDGLFQVEAATQSPADVGVPEEDRSRA